jgi:hypothetical protein
MYSVGKKSATVKYEVYLRCGGTNTDLELTSNAVGASNKGEQAVSI